MLCKFIVSLKRFSLQAYDTKLSNLFLVLSRPFSAISVHMYACIKRSSETLADVIQSIGMRT